MAQDAPRAAVPEVVTDRAAPLTAAETARSPGAAAAADRRWWVLGVVGLAQLMVVLDKTHTSVNMAAPWQRRRVAARVQGLGGQVTSRRPRTQASRRRYPSTVIPAGLSPPTRTRHRKPQLR